MIVTRTTTMTMTTAMTSTTITMILIVTRTQPLASRVKTLTRSIEQVRGVTLTLLCPQRCSEDCAELAKSLQRVGSRHAVLPARLCVFAASVPARRTRFPAECGASGTAAGCGTPDRVDRRSARRACSARGPRRIPGAYRGGGRGVADSSTQPLSEPPADGEEAKRISFRRGEGRRLF